jgi:hypothetical protein
MATDPIRHRSFRSRLAAGLSLSLLLVILAGGVASGAVPATRMALSPHTIPATSCQGNQACSNVTGTVGENACNGDFACFHSFSWSESVGDGSCDAQAACNDIVGSVGGGSCNGVAACAVVTGSVGDGSCNGFASCFHGGAAVGRFSCNGDQACYFASSAVADCANNAADHVPAPCFGTRTAMGSSADPAPAAKPVRLWATVLANYPDMGTPGGTFRFRIDGRTLPDPVPIDGHGRAVIRRTLNPGVHWISGRYLGDGTFAASTPVPLYQFVVP